MYSLQALQQSSVLSYHEQLFLPPTVCFTASRETLEQIDVSGSPLNPLVKALLRSYGGIFDFPCPISEKQLAKALQWPDVEVRKGLQNLHNARVIIFEPQTESPQLRFLQNRVNAAELVIDLAAYAKRKRG